MGSRVLWCLKAFHHARFLKTKEMFLAIQLFLAFALKNGILKLVLTAVFIVRTCSLTIRSQSYYSDSCLLTTMLNITVKAAITLYVSVHVNFTLTSFPEIILSPLAVFNIPVKQLIHKFIWASSRYDALGLESAYRLLGFFSCSPNFPQNTVHSMTHGNHKTAYCFSTVFHS